MHKVKQALGHWRAVAITCLGAAFLVVPGMALAVKPAEPETTTAITAGGEGVSDLIAFLFSFLPYVIGLAVALFVFRWISHKLGFSRS